MWQGNAQVQKILHINYGSLVVQSITINVHIQIQKFLFHWIFSITFTFPGWNGKKYFEILSTVLVKVKRIVSTELLSNWRFIKNLSKTVKCKYTHTYIPLTLYPQRGSRGISDISPRHPLFTKISYLWRTQQTWHVVRPSPSCSLSQV
jgi:hypothetical protein